MERVSFKANDVIFREDEYQKWMYHIVSGSVSIFSAFGTVEQRKLTTLTSGHFFGEIGMIAMVPRTATAVAAEDSVLEMVPYDELLDFVKVHPEYMQQLMQTVSLRIRELTEDLSLVNRSVNEILSRRNNRVSVHNWLSESVQKMVKGIRRKARPEEIFFPRESESTFVANNHPPVATYRKGEVIFNRGDSAQCMYEILDGVVGIYTDYKTENETLLNKLFPEDIFGEMGILDDMPRSATAVCLENCSVLMVKKDCFFDYFQKKPMKILNILQKMCLRLRSLSGEYQRICQTLEALLEESGNQADESNVWNELDRLSQDPALKEHK